MKKIILSFFLFILFSVVYAYASTGDIDSNEENEEKVVLSTLSEEDLCFDILSENVKNQYSIDLSNVEQSSTEGNIINLSTYESFKNYTTVNPNQKYFKDSGLNLFGAKRNNIGTIKASGDYIVSQFSGFGDKTNFTFPLKSSNSNYDLGDLYPDFRQNIIYTHHLKKDRSFVSCGFLRVNPKGNHDLFSVSQDDYKTNVFEGSGFEIIDRSDKREGKNGKEEFLVGKVNVSAIDYADEPLFKIELITVAYNNKSSYFNEFETFPKQVKAMTNTDLQKEGMAGVMFNFIESVQNETCLELLHTPNNFPSKCNNRAKSLSFIDKLFGLFIPSSFAAIESDENYEEEAQKARGIIIYDGLPKALHDKILKIQDENLKNALIASVLPNFDDVIENKKKNNQILTPYEEIFSKCGMEYSERMDNVIDFLNKIDVEKIDYNNFEYLNSKFGDCIIPYPDKSNIGKNIENSFSSLEPVDSTNNKDELNINNKYEEIKKLEEELNRILEDKRQELDEILNPINENTQELENTSKNNEKLNNNLYYVIIFLSFLLAGFFIYMSVRKKK